MDIEKIYYCDECNVEMSKEHYDSNDGLCTDCNRKYLIQ